MPRVSITMGAYNYGRFLGKTIQSVLEQTFSDFELILIDDGSTDDTREVVGRFRDPRIKYVYQENQGPVVVLNRGFQISKGEYIAFLGSDGILLKDALEKSVESLDKHPDSAFSYGQAYLIDEEGHIFGVEKGKQKHSCVRDGRKEIEEFLIEGNHIIASTVMARRTHLIEVGLSRVEFRYGSEDIDLFLRLAKKHTVVHIAHPLAMYRIHTQSMSATREVTEIEESNSRILEGVFNDTELGPIFAPRRDYFYSRLYFRLAGYAYASGEMKTARTYLFRSMRVHPQGFLKSLWLPWMLCFGKTWIPLPVLSLARSIRRRAMIASWRGADQERLVKMWSYLGASSAWIHSLMRELCLR